MKGMNFVKKELEIIARVILKFPVLIFFISFIFMIIAFYFSTKIQINASFRSLLPKDHAVLQTLDEANQIFNHRDIVLICVRSNSFKKGKDFVKNVSKKLKQYSELKEIYYKSPMSFFREKVLLYLDIEDLNKIYKRLNKKINYEKKKGRLGLLLDELVEDDPGFTYDDILSKYTKRLNFDYDKSKSIFLVRKKILANGENSYIFLIIAKPKESALSIAYSQTLISQIDQIIQIEKEKFSEIQSVEYTGRYQKKPESIKTLITNFKRVTFLSLAAILIFLAVFFRSFRPILLLFIGLSYGIFLTLAITQIFIGSLNLISSFLIAILLGLGVDFGIHIILRYKEERDAGKSVTEAFVLMYTETCFSSLIAALTTSFVFASLAFSNFLGFSDFGFIGCVGILCILFAYMTLVPSLILIATRHFKISIILSPMKLYLPPILWRKPRVLIVISSLITILSAISLTQLQFNYDFSRLLGEKGLPSYSLNRELKSLFGKNIDVPMMLITNNKEEEKKLLQYLDQQIKINSQNSPLISASLGLSSFIPSDQPKKLNHIKRIRTLINVNKKYFQQKTITLKGKTINFERQLLPKVFSERDLPAYIKNIFKKKDTSSKKRMVLIYSNIKGEDGLEVAKLANFFSQMRIDSKPVQIASDTLIFAEILKIIKGEGKLIFILACLSIFLMISLSMKNIYNGLIVFLPIVLGLLWMMGTQAILGLTSDFVNVISYIIVLGTSIDAAIHLFHRFEESNDILIASQNTGEAITLSSLTTLLAFGALLFGKNESIIGLGLLTIIGITTNYLSCMLVLPAILKLKNTP